MRLDLALFDSDVTEVGGLFLFDDCFAGVTVVSLAGGLPPARLPIIMLKAFGTGATSLFSVFLLRGLCRTGRDSFFPLETCF